jgi:hypothetical protein
MGVATVAQAAEPAMPIAQQLILYAVVVAGVILSEAVAMARAGRPIRVDLSWPWVLTACLIALLAFPIIWRQIGDLSDTSPLVQAGVAAQGGVFWGVLMAGVEKGTRP